MDAVESQAHSNTVEDLDGGEDGYRAADAEAVRCVHCEHRPDARRREQT